MTSESIGIPPHADITSCTVSDDPNYKNLISQDKGIARFDKLLSQFLMEFFTESKMKPRQCIFTVFTYPGEDYREPMVKIIYPDTLLVDTIKIRDNLEEKFKQFLAKNALNLAEFKLLREIQRKFRFIIRRD